MQCRPLPISGKPVYNYIDDSSSDSDGEGEPPPFDHRLTACTSTHCKPLIASRSLQAAHCKPRVVPNQRCAGLRAGGFGWPMGADSDGGQSSDPGEPQVHPFNPYDAALLESC